MQNRLVKICITGGHVTPAIAVIEQIKLSKPEWRIVFIGRKTAVEGSSTISEEFRLIGNLGIPFYALTTGRIQRHISRYTIPSLFKIPVGCLQALWFCIKEKPDVVLSFGGYIAFPVALAAWLLGIPVVIHEQTSTVGLANRFISTIARRICVNDLHSQASFPAQKTVVTGLPLRKSLFDTHPRSHIEIESSVPLLYITGGTTGARSLNDLIFPIIDTLTNTYHIVHQVGRISIQEGQKIRASLSAKKQSRYTVVAYLDEKDHGFMMQKATLCLGRAGANTVWEIAALGKVAIFVPLPWSAGKEQEKNADFIATSKAGVKLDQQTLTPQKLLMTIEDVMGQLVTYKKHAIDLSNKIPRDGAARTLQEIVFVLTYA